MGDLDPKLFYLKRDRNSVGLGDYGHYLHDGGNELVNSLNNVTIGVVARITSVIASILVSWQSSSTSWGSIIFNVANSFFANCLSTRITRTTMSG